MDFKTTMEVLNHFDPAQSVLLMGNHGLGKSDCVKLAATTMGIPCIDIRLSQCDVGDLKGMPFHVKGRTYFAPPDFYPLKESDATELSSFIGDEVQPGLPAGILFLDEINRANREVQQAAFEIVLDRRLNQRQLPEGWRVVAAMNHDDDLYSVLDLDPAFLDRFFVINFRPGYEEWMDWAKESGEVHDVVMQFLMKYDKFLDPTKESIKDATSKAQKTHGRRSWHHMSRTIKSYAKCGVDLLDRTPQNLDLLFQITQGHVGNQAATQFKTFVETDYQSLDANIILNKWDKNVKRRLQDVIDANRIPELAAYNMMIIEFIKDKVNKNLNNKQCENLTEFMELIPNEVGADFWKKFNADCSSISTHWYKSGPTSDRNKKRMLGILANPDRLKK
jgi:hypothetical protein